VAGKRRLSIVGFLVIVVIYLAIIEGIGALVSDSADLEDGKLLTTREVAIATLVPLGAALVFVYAVVAVLRWWRT
jgi:uncharacterized protein